MTVDELTHDWLVWQKKLRGFAERQLRFYDVPSGRLDADDVVQHTWLALRTAKDPIRHADRYAYQVIKSVVRKAASEGRRFALPSPTADVPEEPAEAHELAREQVWNSPVEHEVLRLERLAKISDIKEVLTLPQRTAVEGTVEHGLSRAEVAARMKVGVGTVSAHRDRGLRKLKSHAQFAGLVALFTLAGFFSGSVLLFVLVRMVLESGYGGMAVVVVAGGGYGLATLHVLYRLIQQIKAATARAEIMAFLVCAMLAGTWAIWWFGLAADGLSMGKGLFMAVVAMIIGGLLLSPALTKNWGEIAIETR
ncbi:sigma-70 family RNA polymerase sigma factor [Saccharopolyspora taberi]|uniref:Uncharacterized protein n=1 Tax=Saccharopolyspora taberi TaxID=60895 RepID=A0ABN3VJF1_9PSEU